MTNEQMIKLAIETEMKAAEEAMQKIAELKKQIKELEKSAKGHMDKQMEYINQLQAL